MNHTEKNFLIPMATCVLSMFVIMYGVVQVKMTSPWFWLFPALVVLGNIGVFVFLMRKPWLATFKKLYTAITIVFVGLLVTSVAMMGISEFTQISVILLSIALLVTIFLEQMCWKFFLRRREL